MRRQPPLSEPRPPPPEIHAPSDCAGCKVATQTRAGRGDVVALAVFGGVISISVMGHFVMPHPDFFEFVDSGRAMLDGRLPPTMKRGPVFSLLIAGLGRIVRGEAPELTAAAWLNALLLPLNGVLVYLIGARWIGAAARWAAVAFLVMPMSLYCTAHVIVEPLLVCLILSTLLLAQRGVPWAYLTAALATLTRYDAAGLIVGLFIADLVARRRAWTATWRAAAAALPLAAWLVLTVATWSTRSYDHYLAQIATRSAHEVIAGLPGGLVEAVVRAVNTVFDSRFDPQRLMLPGLLQTAADWFPAGLTWLIGLLALAGIVGKSRDRDAAGITAIVALAAYLVVHAVFPFQFHRFGYPPAGLIILLAGAGWKQIAHGSGKLPPPPRVRLGIIGVAIVVLALALTGEASAYAGISGANHRWVVSLAMIAIVATAVIWGGRRATHQGGAGGIAILLVAVLFVSVQMRTAVPLLGSGRELANQVEAARWIRDHAGEAEKVVSGSPGLFRLYAGRTSPGRFIGFQDLHAAAWPEILAECRAVGVRYIVWHDQLAQEHGGYYAQKWGLSRFDLLADAGHTSGVTVERRFAKYPDLAILRVEGVTR